MTNHENLSKFKIKKPNMQDFKIIRLPGMEVERRVGADVLAPFTSENRPTFWWVSCSVELETDEDERFDWGKAFLTV